MNRQVTILLIISVILLNVIFLASHSFLAFYYVLWLGGVGAHFLKHRAAVEVRLESWRIPSFPKFFLIGLGMIVLEETFAGFSMHLAEFPSPVMMIIGILQFYAFNLIALPGFIIGWYVLLRRYVYSEREIFILAGLFGLFSEKIYMHVLGVPIAGILLILPTMFTYALIIAPSVVSFRGEGQKHLPRIVRYLCGFFVPILVSIPFILLLMYLRAHYPGVFPPPGFVG